MRSLSLKFLVLFVAVALLVPMFPHILYPVFVMKVM